MNNKVMQVHLHANPNEPEGLGVQFAYDPAAVDRVKLVLGVNWNKNHKLWLSQGPEILLDMERFGIKPVWLSGEARRIAEDFRQQLWASMEARAEPIYDEEYGYQRQGMKFLALQKRAILGDDMGLGKTKQALDAAFEIGAEKILVLAPKTLVYNWLAEIQKWHPEYTAAVVPDVAYAGTSKRAKQRANRQDLWKDRPNIVIANYEKLRISDWPYNLDWDVLICDEATRLKNSTTATWQNTRRIAKRSKYVWGLTGTPLEIRLEELYNIFALFRPAVLGNYPRFREQHCVVDWGGSIVGAQNLELLRERIGYWMLRRTKEEVLDNLPAKVYNNQFIQMSTVEQKEYQQLLMDFKNWLTEHGTGGSNDPLVQTMRLQQYCCSPALFDIGRKGSKYEALVDTINEWDGRLIVFCFFEQMINLLSQWLPKDVDCNPRALISGKIETQERLTRVDLFNEGKLGKVFLSTDAGNQGLNITGADMVVHYSPLWNPQKMKQREDRSHRIGQKKTVNVVNLLYVDSIDYGMYELGKEREELFREVIEGAEEAMIRKLSPDRLKRIAEGRLHGRASAIND